MTTTGHRPPSAVSPAGNPMGFGRMLRKEDARFLRGQGHFLDDLTMPGMLHAAILRSPVAHARIVSIDTSEAEAHPKVKAVITGALLESLNLAWMPTLSADVQAVLATDKVRFQGQEVAMVIAEDRYCRARCPRAHRRRLRRAACRRRRPQGARPRTRRSSVTTSRAAPTTTSSTGRRATRRKTDEVFARAEVVVRQDMLYPRSHPAPMETCGTIASMDKVTGKLTVWSTNQAPHAHRTIYALVAGIPEHNIQIISPDIGGGFGNKVGIYPGYVLAVVGSIVTGSPVKWVEDRSENLMSTSFARDYHMKGEIAATRDGRITGLRVDVLADHGAFNGTAQPTKFPAGFFHIFTGSYDLEAAYCKVSGVYTNKAPGGVAYACSFRITEAVYLVERMVDVLADELGIDPAELRLRNLLKPEQFPYTTMTGWEYDSGDYPRTLRKAMEMAGYDELRREQAEKRERGELMGIGSASSPRASAPAPASTWTSWASGWPTAASCACTRPGRRSCGSRCRPRARGTRRRSPRSWPRSSASHPRTSTSSMATRATRRSASGRTAPGPPRSPARPPRSPHSASATRPG